VIERRSGTVISSIVSFDVKRPRQKDYSQLRKTGVSAVWMEVSLFRSMRHRLPRLPKSLKESVSEFERVEMEVVFADDSLRVTALGKSSQPNVFLCFTGVQQAMGGIGAEEFVRAAHMPGFSALFISDLKRSWFNGFPPSHLQKAISGRTRGKRLVTVGNSMGGYGAIWATSYFPISCAIAFAAQFSVHEDIVPEERRWMEFRRDIKEWRHRSLENSFNNKTKYFTINGSDDDVHWTHFPRKSNCNHILIQHSGHNPASVLKRKHLLSEVLAACTKGEDPYDLICKGGCEAVRID
jgi:hypothetical protein